MNQFNFWQKILQVASLVMVLMGVFIALFNQSSIFNYIFNNPINATFWSSDNFPSNIVQFRSWVYGVLGATISGWGIFIAFIVHYPFKEKQKWSWYCIAIGIIVWFIIDTSISAYFSVYFNVVFNTILFLSIVVPLFFTKKYFNSIV